MMAISLLIGAGCSSSTPSDLPSSPTTSIEEPTTTEPTTTAVAETTTTTAEPVEEAPATTLAPKPRSAPITTVYDPPSPQSRTTGGSGAPLACIRSYEQGADGYATDTGNGYYGAYQVDQQTWESVGGKGNPAHASPAEQDKRATMLYNSRGLAPWPTPERMC